MNRTIARRTMVIAVLTAACFLAPRAPRAQQAGGQNSDAPGTQRPDSTASAGTENQAGASGESSSWTAGKGSFGTAGASTWTPGTGGFASTKQAGGIWRDEPASGPATGAATGTRTAPALRSNPFSVYPARPLGTLSSPRGLVPGKPGSHSFSSSTAQHQGAMTGGTRNLGTKAGPQNRTGPLNRSSTKGGTKTFSGFGSGAQSSTGFKSHASTSSGESHDSEPGLEPETSPH